MRDWILGYRKSATDAGDALDNDAWPLIEQELNQSIPEELRDLYAQMDGGRLNGVELFSFRPTAGGRSVTEASRETLSGFSEGALLRFGTKGDQQLFVTRRRSLRDVNATSPLPAWLDMVDDDAFVYGVFNAETREVKVYRTLEHMLAILVPPAQVEEFGENTLARAMTVVRGAMESLEEEPTEPSVRPVSSDDAKTETNAPVRAAKSRSAPRAKSKAKAAKPAKASSKKKAAKRSPPKRAKKPAAKKAAKKAAKRPAAKKAAPKRRPAAKKKSAPPRRAAAKQSSKKKSARRR